MSPRQPMPHMLTEHDNHQDSQHRPDRGGDAHHHGTGLQRQSGRNSSPELDSPQSDDRQQPEYVHVVFPLRRVVS